jgi:hypothetical protein
LRTKWPGFVFLIVVGVLVPWNLHVIHRNQSLFGPNDQLMVRSKSIETVAAENPFHAIRTTFTTYHRLARRFAGKTLVIPAKRAAHRFALERLSRLAIEVVLQPMTLPGHIVDRLVETQLVFSWELDAGRPLGVIMDDVSTRYVLAERDDQRVEILLPESLYLRERAALAEAPR